MAATGKRRRVFWTCWLKILQLAISRHPIIPWAWLTGRFTRVIHYARKRVGTEKGVHST